LDTVQVPVAVSDVQVRPDDIVVCDDSGVPIAPFDEAEEAFTAAVEIDEAEQRILKLLRKGMTLKEARENIVYH